MREFFGFPFYFFYNFLPLWPPLASNMENLNKLKAKLTKNWMQKT